jgi:IstB-like ATP binding protein
VHERARPGGRPAGSDGQGELTERCAEPVAVAGEGVGGESAVSLADVPGEGQPGGEDPRGLAALEPAHRPEPAFQPAVTGLGRVAYAALDGMQRGGDQLIEDPRIRGCPVGGDLSRDGSMACWPNGDALTKARYFTAANLTETLYRGLADNSVGRIIDGLLRHDLIIIDEVGFAPLDDTGAQLLFRVVAAAYERRALAAHHRRQPPEQSPAPRQRRRHQRRLLPHARSQSQRRNTLNQN